MNQNGSPRRAQMTTNKKNVAAGESPHFLQNNMNLFFQLSYLGA
jgi:hypothetical protein